MVSLGAHGEPSEVAAESGEVIVEGPDGVAVTLTPDAAEETARRMMAAADSVISSVSSSISRELSTSLVSDC